MASDDYECVACGEVLGDDDTVCPYCGVPRREEGWHSSPPEDVAQQSSGQSDVSQQWWYGIAGGVVLWVLVLFVPVGESAIVGQILNATMVVAWAGLPLAAYFDMQYVRDSSAWQPRETIWVLLFAIWFVNIAAGVVYLYRRHEELGVP